VNVGQFHIGATGPLDDRWEEDDRSQGSNNGAVSVYYTLRSSPVLIADEVCDNVCPWQMDLCGSDCE
jgi:hypothetical protein